MIFNPVIKKSSPVVETASLKDINFYDYEGTLLYSYTFSELQELANLPKGPTHEGLIFQGWNWSLEDVKALTRPMNVGAMYITDDGKTRLKIHVWDQARSNVSLYISQTAAHGVTIDWGDGSAVETLDGTGNVNTAHQYVETGDYTISLAVADGCTLGFGDGTENYSLMGNAKGNGIVYCNLLQEVNIGEKVTSIANYAFYNCRSLGKITMPSGVTRIIGSSFNNCYSLANINLPESITSIGNYMAYNCVSLMHCSIPRNMRSIGNNAFYNCNSLTSITISENITSIANYIFYSAFSLENIIIPESVTDIGNYAFRNCQSLASITIPESVTSIGNHAFYDCHSLASITIPENVTSIGNSAFYNCYSVAEYHLKPTTPPTLTDVNAFEGIPSDCMIYVPAGSLEAYKTAENWSTYASYMREEPLE